MAYVQPINFSHMHNGLRGLISYFAHWHEVLDTAENTQSAVHNLRTTLRLAEAERDASNANLQAIEQALGKEHAHALDLEKELADTKRSLQQSEIRRLRITENLSALAADDYETVYCAIKGDMDPEGWRLYFTACRNTSRSVSEAFSTEDNLGYFEEMDGDALLPWLECANFGHCEWRQLDCPGGYEMSYNRTIDTESEVYKTYRAAIFKEVVTELLFG